MNAWLAHWARGGAAPSAVRLRFTDRRLDFWERLRLDHSARSEAWPRLKELMALIGKAEPYRTGERQSRKRNRPSLMYDHLERGKLNINTNDAAARGAHYRNHACSGASS